MTETELSDPEFVNNLNLVFRILKQIDDEEIPSICVNEYGIYYTTEKSEELEEIVHRIVGIDDYVEPIAIYGRDEYDEPYVCIINPTRVSEQ